MTMSGWLSPRKACRRRRRAQRRLTAGPPRNISDVAFNAVMQSIADTNSELNAEAMAQQAARSAALALATADAEAHRLFQDLQDLDSDALASSEAGEGMVMLMFLSMGAVEIAKVTTG